MGSPYFRWFNIGSAEAITTTGQLIIRLVANKLNAHMAKTFGSRDYVLGSDTDSVLLSIDPVVKNDNGSVDQLVAKIDSFCEETLQPIINSVFSDIHTKLNTIQPILAMKREAIAEHGVWTAKKRYILWIHNNEGVRYDPPKMKIVGIEAKRSSTPKHARKVIEQALEAFVKSDRDAFNEIISKAEEQFDVLPFSEIASPRSVNGLDEYPILPDGEFSNKTPIHVKGALVYNRELKTHGIEERYEAIKEGQKIRYCYLKTPNPFRVNAIASPGELPKEWQMNSYLDTATQFDKTVVQPLENIVKYASWTVRPMATLF